MPFTIAASNVWQRVSFTVPRNTATSAGWPINSPNLAMTVLVTLAAGSSTATSATGSWVTPAITAVGNVNFLSSTSNVMYITCMQLKRGTIATAFEFRPYCVELQLCKRYYKLQQLFPAGVTNNNYNLTFYGAYQVTKRILPALSSSIIGGPTTNTRAITWNPTSGNNTTPVPATLDNFTYMLYVNATGYWNAGVNLLAISAEM